MKLKFWSKPEHAKTRIEVPELKLSPDPFREVVEYADFERMRLLEYDVRGLSERELGMVMAYGNVVRAALEATGMLPRQVLK